MFNPPPIPVVGLACAATSIGFGLATALCQDVADAVADAAMQREWRRYYERVASGRVERIRAAAAAMDAAADAEVIALLAVGHYRLTARRSPGA